MSAKVDGNTQSEFDAWCAYKGTLPKRTEIEQLQRTYDLLLRDVEQEKVLARLRGDDCVADLKQQINAVRKKLIEMHGL